MKFENLAVFSTRRFWIV